MADLAIIFRTHSDIEASLVRGLLEAHGIESMASSDVPHSVFPLSIDGLGEVRVSVRPDDAVEATRIIEDHQARVERVRLVPLRREFEDLQQRMAYRFRDRGLLEHALTHRSKAHEDASGGVIDNESLEFLGDSVVGLVVADLLFREHPRRDEGYKSKVKSRLVSTASLAALAERLELGRHLLLGRGEEQSGGRAKQALLANTFEAVVAAVYLDGGLEAARAFVEREIRPSLDETTAGEQPALSDHKSALQEWLQGRGQDLPEYRVAAEWGPDHDKRFEVEVLVNGEAVSREQGRSKKVAEQAAAAAALTRLRQDGPAPEASAPEESPSED